MIGFEKVSFDTYKNSYEKCFCKELKHLNEEQRCNFIKVIWDNIKLPKRSTIGSAGYDFYAPQLINISKHNSIIIPTGIKVHLEVNTKIKSVLGDDMGLALIIIPRSGLGFKYGLSLSNTLGLIDSDYINSDNEGHILIKLVNDSDINDKEIIIEKDKAFAQGVIVPYFTTDDDNTTEERNGGFGSTDK